MGKVLDCDQHALLKMIEERVKCFLPLAACEDSWSARHILCYHWTVNDNTSASAFSFVSALLYVPTSVSSVSVSAPVVDSSSTFPPVCSSTILLSSVSAASPISSSVLHVSSVIGASSSGINRIAGMYRRTAEKRQLQTEPNEMNERTRRKNKKACH